MKKKIKSVPCPCCQQQKASGDIKRTTSLFPFDGIMANPDTNLTESFIEVVARHKSYYQWACDKCIVNKKALIANPKRQKFTFSHPMDTAPPFLAYYDKPFVCKICNEESLFLKEEQQHWYEVLSFVVFAKCTTCKSCRNELRPGRMLNKELSDLLADGIPSDKDKLMRIIAIYKKMEKEERVKFYSKILNKNR